MLFQRINRSTPEKIFVVGYNTLTTALSNGQAVVWDYLAEADGVSVTKPVNAAVSAGTAFAGIVSESIAPSAYGLIQVYGYHAATRVHAASAAGGATAKGALKAVTSGTPLSISQVASYALEACHTASATSFMYFPGAFAFGANAEWTTAAIAVFVKAL